MVREFEAVISSCFTVIAIEHTRNANRLGYFTPDYEWGEWNIKDKPIPYLTDDEEQNLLKELDPSVVKDPKHKKGRRAARDIFILMVDGGFRIYEASVLKWSDADFNNGVIYLYRSKVSNDDFIPMTSRHRLLAVNPNRCVQNSAPIHGHRIVMDVFTRPLPHEYYFATHAHHSISTL